MRSARTDKDLIQPQHWQAFDRGDALKKACQRVCNDLASRMFGYYLVKLGPLSAEIALPDCPIRHQVALNTHGDVAQARALNTELPIQGNSVDAFFLSLELDFASDPHRVLREIDHGITANGCILLCCLNPFSAAGITKYMPVARKHPLKRARFFSPMRVKDWLHLLHYEVIEERYFFLSTRVYSTVVAITAQSNALDAALLRALSWLDGIGVLFACKKTNHTDDENQSKMASGTAIRAGQCCQFGGYFTRIPGRAPSCGSRINRSLPPGPAAKTIPSDRPKRIFRGAKFATITVCLPIKSSGS